jgi:hypothetical protein
MNANLHLDDDLAIYLNEQAEKEHTTLDVVLNRVLRQSVPAKPSVPNDNDSWLAELRRLREICSTGKPGTPIEDLVADIRS